MSLLIDQFGRKHDYLRISVTDRCNLRCLYCMPEEGVKFISHDDLLTYEEITKIVRVVAGLGIKKIRLTGGEPLVRKDLEVLVRNIKQIEGITDIALTTNAYFLDQKAESLKEAGISRVNISLDSLNPERFKEITRGGNLDRVMAGLQESIRVGFNPIKINTVLMKGFNDDEIGDFLELTINQPLQIRFIEYMPIGHAGESWSKSYLSLDYVKEQAKALGYELSESDGVYGNGPADNFKIKGAKGSIGLIHPVSENFCSSCNRLRLTSDGHLKACLYWDEELNLKKHLGNDRELEQVIYQALQYKPENHEMAKMISEETQSFKPTARRMSQIGG